MRVRSVAAAAVVSTLFCAFAALPASAGVLAGTCIPFDHKLQQEVLVMGPGFQCTLEAKVHVDPKDACESRFCPTSNLGNALPEVGALLKVEVVSFCGDAIPDSVVEGPNVLDGTVDGSVSACIGGAQVSQVVPQEGKIKLNCNDGNAKTKGDFEYQCTPRDP